MSDENGPWEHNTGGDGPRFPLGVFLWVGLLAVVGIGIWLLSVLFPGQISASEYSRLDIIRLVAILAFVSSGLIFARQINFGEVARNISIWTGLAAIILVGYTYRFELEEVFNRVGGELVPANAVATDDNGLVITASADGHFYVNGRANGQRIRFMIDTGASNITLSPQDASRIGINLSELRFNQRFQTANGVGLGAPYRLDSLSIGSFEFADTRVSVNGADMSTSLLGMSFLERLKSFEFRGSKLYLRR
jgi:aspartyl protease family protein